MESSEVDTVIICGPKLIADALKIYVAALGKTGIEKVYSKEELEQIFADRGSVVSMAILVNIYPVFDNDMEFVRKIKDIRLRKMTFPIIALGVSVIKDPIIKAKGHSAYKLPLKLEDLTKAINTTRTLKDNQLRSIIARHLEPLLLLNDILYIFRCHDMLKLTDKIRENEFWSYDLQRFRRSFTPIYKQRNELFGDELEIIPYLEVIEQLTGSRETIEAMRDDLDKALSDAITFCGGPQCKEG